MIDRTMTPEEYARHKAALSHVAPHADTGMSWEPLPMEFRPGLMMHPGTLFIAIPAYSGTEELFLYRGLGTDTTFNSYGLVSRYDSHRDTFGEWLNPEVDRRLLTNAIPVEVIQPTAPLALRRRRRILL